MNPNKTVLEIAEKHGVTGEDAEAIADAVYRHDIPAINKLASRLKIPRDSILTLHKLSEASIRKSKVYIFTPTFSSGSLAAAILARQGLSKNKRMVKSIGRGHGMGPETQALLWKAVKTGDVDEVTRLANKHKIASDGVKTIIGVMAKKMRSTKNTPRYTKKIARKRLVRP